MSPARIMALVEFFQQATHCFARGLVHLGGAPRGHHGNFSIGRLHRPEEHRHLTGAPTAADDPLDHIPDPLPRQIGPGRIVHESLLGRVYERDLAIRGQSLRDDFPDARACIGIVLHRLSFCLGRNRTEDDRQAPGTHRSGLPRCRLGRDATQLRGHGATVTCGGVTQHLLGNLSFLFEWRKRGWRDPRRRLVAATATRCGHTEHHHDHTAHHEVSGFAGTHRSGSSTSR